MSVDTRQKILHIAKQLFNERGINEVSIADIASSVGFRHYAQIAQMIPRVAQQQRKVFSFFRAVMMQSFMNLGELGLVDQSKKPEEFDSVIDAVFMTCVFWLPFSELKGKASKANGLTQCEFYLKAILTEEGLQELNKVHG